MIDTILFDLDDTILDFKKTEEMALSGLFSEICEGITEEIIQRYSKINLSLWKKLELKKITRERLKVKRFEILYNELGIHYSPEKSDEIYRKYLSEGVEFVEGARKTVEQLSEKYRLYIVTNGTAQTQQKRMEKSGLNCYFENVFISEELGANKPDKEFFSKCFERIEGFKRENTIIIGDSLTSDILGGKRAGIKTIWFNKYKITNETDIIPDIEVVKMDEILDFFK